MVTSWSNLHAADSSGDPTGARDGSQTQAHKLARSAVLALHNALAASRQHPNAPEVWCPGIDSSPPSSWQGLGPLAAQRCARASTSKHSSAIAVP